MIDHGYSHFFFSLSHFVLDHALIPVAQLIAEILLLALPLGLGVLVLVFPFGLVKDRIFGGSDE